MRSEKPTIQITIVIPTYSEELWLPILFNSIYKQTVSPLEIIIADANSPDKTRKISKEFGATIVDGGNPAEGRNSGAKVAKGEYLLFLDADTELPNDSMLENVLNRIKDENIDVASVKFYPSTHFATKFGLIVSYILYFLWNIGRFSNNPAFEGGAFIIVKRSVFKDLGGFDESLFITEDCDFFMRAVEKNYKYKMLHNMHIKISTRRLNEFKSAYNLTKRIVNYLFLTVKGYSLHSKEAISNWKSHGLLGGGTGRGYSPEK